MRSLIASVKFRGTDGAFSLRSAVTLPLAMPVAASERQHHALDCAPMPAADVHPAIAEAKRVLEVEAAAILSLIEGLDDAFVQVVELIDACNGRVVTMGLGKS